MRRVGLAATVAIPAFLFPLLAGCGDTARGASWTGTIDTLATGVIRVTNPETGAWTGDAGWRLVEELRIGSALEEGPAMFGNIAALEADEDGRIFVADGQAHEIRVFGPDGRHLFTFGRKGAGPGEFEQIAGMGWGPDGNLWVMDARNSRFAVFDRAGAQVTEHRRPGGFIFLPWPGGFDDQGRIYDIGMAPDPEDRFRAALIRYRYRGEAGIEPRDTFRIPRYEGPTFTLSDDQGRARIMAGIPFAPTQVWRLGNGVVWMGITDAYRLHRVGFEGDTVRIIERAFTPAPVTAAEKDSIIETMKWFTDQGGRVDRSRIPDRKGAYMNVTEDDAGYLWVWPQQARDDAPGLDVFDPEGRYLGRVPTGERLMPWGRTVIRGDRFYTVVRDDLEVQYVARFRIDGRERERRVAGEE